MSSRLVLCTDSRIGADVEGRHRPEVDHLDGDALLAHPLGRGDGLVDHPRDRHDGDVGPGAHDRGPADGDDVVGRWLRTLHAVEQPVLDEDHRVGVLDGRTEQPVGVGRRRRHDDGQPGDVGQQHLEALGVLAPRGAPGAELGPHGQRHLGRPAGHERELRRLVEQLVEADAEEVEVHHLDHGAHPGHGRAHAEADDRRLGDRGVAHAVTEPVGQPPGEPEDVAARRRRRCRPRTPGRPSASSASSADVDGVHGAEHRRVRPAAAAAPTGAGRARTTKSVKRGRRRAGQPAGGLDGLVELVGHRDSSALISSSPDARRPSRPSWTSSGSRASHSLSSSGDR